MTTTNLSPKDDLIQWINELNDNALVTELIAIKEKIIFYEKFKKGISSDQARIKSIDFLKSLDWKK